MLSGDLGEAGGSVPCGEHKAAPGWQFLRGHELPLLFSRLSQRDEASGPGGTLPTGLPFPNMPLPTCGVARGPLRGQMVTHTWLSVQWKDILTHTTGGADREDIPPRPGEQSQTQEGKPSAIPPAGVQEGTCAAT